LLDEDRERPDEEATREGAGETKRKKKSADTDEIRDRNKRLREEAAGRRRDRREQQAGAAQAQGLDASEMVDDALARATHNLLTFVKRNFQVIQWVVVIGIVGGIGWQIYSYRADKATRQHGDLLSEALRAETGRVAGESDSKTPAERGYLPEDTRPEFETEASRLETAAKGYREAIEKGSSEGAKLLARLGLASILFEQRKHDEARQEYESVKAHKLTNKHRELQGRALEGVGLSLEAKGDKDGALKAFRELENAAIPGFTPLALYHQARILHAQGKTAEAKPLATKAQEQLEKDAELGVPGGYLTGATRELMASIDPSTAASGAPQMTPEQIQRLRQQIEALSKAGSPADIEKLLDAGAPPKAPGDAP
jgi:predicted negative regulator of RcsB-dependent stress response